MLSIVAPGKLVLTLQSIPPFVVESVFALALAVLLAVPLILHVQHLLDDPMYPRGKTSFTRRCIEKKNRTHSVVTHYPASLFVDSASSSSVNLQLETARKTISTPILQASGDNVDTLRDNRALPSVLEDETWDDSKRKEVPLKQSSSFVATNSELPIIDISAFDYDAYRHKLIEDALRKQYDDYQPPGDVVLNSIHLNDNDSMVAVCLNHRYHHSLFDFVEEYYDATKGMSRKEAEYMHPLDHFLVKGAQKLETVEKETETNRVEVADTVSQDEKSPRISFYDDTAVTSGPMLRKDPSLKKSARSSNARPSSAGADSTSSKRSALGRFHGAKSATKFSRTNSSTDSASSKRDTLSGSQKRENRRETVSSVDEVERESINCTTASSIDSESVRSESSKLRDDHSCHSRDSSVASKRYSSEKSRIQPWLTGNPQISFNKKYGNTTKPSVRAFEASRRNPTVKRSRISNKPSLHQNSELAGSQVSTNLPPVARTSDKNVSRSRNGQPIKLEAIRSETDESLKVDTCYLQNNSTTHSKVTNNDDLKSESRKASQEDSARPFKGTSERSVKSYKRTRSKTVGPTLTKPSSKMRPDAKPNESAIKMATESARSFKEEVKKRPDGEQPRKPSYYSRLESTRNKEEKRSVQKVPEDYGRKKVMKNLSSVTTAKYNSTGSRMSTISKSSAQKSVDSKMNNNVTGSESIRIRSSKSPSIDRKSSRNEKVEKSGSRRLGSKETGSDKLKLPRRNSKVGVAMQAGLKKYIKKLKRVLSERDNTDMGELASLSLTDAILPDLESSLSSVEVQQVQKVLSMAERKSELMLKNLPVVTENAL